MKKIWIVRERLSSRLSPAWLALSLLVLLSGCLGIPKGVQPVQDFVSSIEGLAAIGRYGAFKYNNQDHSILMGLLAAENIHDGAKHDLWMINTDYEYQEAAVITKTGLQKTNG